MKRSRLSRRSSLSPISKKRLARMTEGLKEGVRLKKLKRAKRKDDKIIVQTKTGLHFIEGHPLYGKMIFRASDIPDRADLMRRADALFSEVVRRRATKDRPISPGITDMLRCFICDEPVHWKEAHLMHCEPRGCISVRFDRINCQAGCPECNMKPNGDRRRFRQRINRQFGPGSAERNTIASKRMHKWSTTDLMELIKELEQELKTLL